MMLRRTLLTALLLTLPVAASLNSKDVIFDYVIAGGGTAGLLLATELTKDPNVTVAVLEAGGDARRDPRITVPEKHGAIVETIYDWNFTTVPQDDLDQSRSVTVPRGKVLGGTSAMNFMIWNRASQVEFDAWQDILGNPGWNWSTMYRANKQSEHFHVPPRSRRDVLTYRRAYHGFSGPVHASMPRSIYSFYPDYLLPALKSLNVTVPRDRDGGDTSGAGFVPLSVKPNPYARSYSASAYTAVQHRRNLHVVTNALVTRILWASQPDSSGLVVANGLEYRLPDSNLSRRASARTVVLSAGSIQTPPLLERSGVGDPAILSQQGIETRIPLRAVGKHLADHPTLAVTFTFNSTPPGGFSGGAYTQSLLDLAPASRFLPASSRAELRSMLAMPQPSGTSPAAVALLDRILATDEPLVEVAWFYNFATLYLLHPLSTGSVHLSASSPSQIAIDPAYNGARLNATYAPDVRILASALRWLCATLPAAPPLAQLGARCEGVDADAPLEVLAARVRTGLGGGDHFTGGAAMGPDGVVDERLRVRGARNLRVVDLSVVPAQPGQHTQGLAWAVAERAAEMFAEERRGRVETQGRC